MKTQIPDYLTYQQHRKCLLCNTPIADQSHATIKFCPREELPDGSIKFCKDDYHAENNKEKNLPYRNISSYHKEAHARIENLLAQKGEIITTDHLDQYGIQLNRPIQIDMPPSQKAVFYFVEFCFTQINNTQFKISRHELTF